MVTKILSLLLLPSTLFSLVSSATTPTKCYFLDGSTGKQAGYRCNNATSGHSSCCAQGGICYSNGVCQQSNGDVQDYLRVGCTDQTWQDAACLDQCTTFAKSSTAGIRFCDGSITDTNKYCCDNGSKGIGSFACCDNASNIFAINPIATVLAQIPLVYTSSSISSSKTTKSTSLTSAAAAKTTSSITPTSTPTESAKSISNKGTAIGAGVGVPIGVLILAGLAFLFWRHRKKSRKQQAFELENSRPGHDQYTDGNLPVMEAEGSVPGAAGGKKGYFGGREYTAAPQELAQPDVVHEIGDSVRT